MGRQKRIIKLPDFLIEELRNIANNRETMSIIQEKYKEYNPDISEFCESEITSSQRIIDNLIKECNIKGKPSKETLKEYQEYYEGVE